MEEVASSHAKEKNATALKTVALLMLRAITLSPTLGVKIYLIPFSIDCRSYYSLPHVGFVPSQGVCS